MHEQKAKRPKVTSIVVELTYPNGQTEKKSLDPQKTEAIFFSDRAVLEILAPFYDIQGHDKEMTKKELIARFGPEAGDITGPNDKVKLTRDVIKKIWELKKGPAPSGIAQTAADGNGSFKLGLLSKSHDCLPG